MSVPLMHSSYPVLFFDGVCNFCNSTVNLIIRLDKKAVFKFAPLQSETARQMLSAHDYPADEIKSVVLVCDAKLYEKSDAALQICKHLGGFWRFLRIFTIIPRPIRDGIYDLIAKNRYSWFGKKDQCMIPTPEVRERFLA